MFDRKVKSEQFGYKYFKNNRTIISTGPTGSGKTTVIANHYERVLKNHPEYKLVSIIDKETMAKQHCKSFENIEMESYKDVGKYRC